MELCCIDPHPDGVPPRAENNDFYNVYAIPTLILKPGKGSILLVIACTTWEKMETGKFLTEKATRGATKRPSLLSFVLSLLS